MSYDAEIGIVGAGPAGALAAELLADRGVEVVVFDPRVPWDKPCGGGLTAGLLREIPELEELRSQANSIARVRFETERATVDVPLEHPMAIVARERLAAWQLQRFLTAGAGLVPLDVTSVRRTDGGWRISTAEGGEWRTQRLVGADGAASRVRRVVAPGLELTRAAARVAYPRKHLVPDGDMAVIRFIRGLDGYLWDFPRADHSSVGIGALSGGWNRTRLDAQMRQLESMEDGDGKHTKICGASIPVFAHARGTNYHSIGGSDFALLGDAAGLADPLTGEGIRNALRSAVCLAAAYARTRSFGAYPDIVASRLEDGFRVSRLIHALVLKGLLLRLLTEAGSRARFARLMLGAALNAGNEHDTGKGALRRVHGMRLAKVS